MCIRDRDYIEFHHLRCRISSIGKERGYRPDLQGILLLLSVIERAGDFGPMSRLQRQFEVVISKPNIRSFLGFGIEWQGRREPNPRADQQENNRQKTWRRHN